MNKKQFILLIKIENPFNHYSKHIKLDDFNSFEKCDDWANWLKEIYEKVKEKND